MLEDLLVSSPGRDGPSGSIAGGGGGGTSAAVAVSDSGLGSSGGSGSQQSLPTEPQVRELLDRPFLFLTFVSYTYLTLLTSYRPFSFYFSAKFSK
jgi:hypothetical protein